jgi:chitinase
MRPIVSYILLTLSTSATAWQSPGRPCPVPCSISGKDPRNWTDLHGVTALERCNEPVLFDTAVWTYVNDPLIPITLRSCTASEHNVTIQPTFQPGPFIFGKPLGRRSRITEASYTSNSTNHQTSNVSIAAHSCSSDVEVFHKSSALDFHFWNGNPNDMTGDFFSAAASLSEYVASQNDCASTIMFARHKKAVLGMFIGTEVSTSSAATVLRRFISKLERKDSVSQYVAQACRPQFPASWMLGIFADFRGNISATQEALRTWTQGKCLEGIRSNSSSEEIELDLIRATSIPLGTGLYKGFHQFSEPIDEPKKLSRSLTPRADCKAIQAVANDGCYSLSQRCGISQKDFESYNPTKDLCDPVKGIQPKQWVCCSKGSLPDSEWS